MGGGVLRIPVCISFPPLGHLRAVSGNTLNHAFHTNFFISIKCYQVIWHKIWIILQIRRP